MKKAVVIGAGFAGLMALSQLIKSKKLELTLINDKGYFLFTPRLTELLNNSISEKIVIKPIKQIFGNKVNLIREKAISVDFKNNIVETKNKKINYDYLIMAQGATTNYFGNKNIEENTIGYKDYNKVLEIKKKIKNNIKNYSKNKKKELLTFAVIGAGLTGIELICSLREFVIREIKKYPDINPAEARFLLIHGGKAIVPQFPEKVGKIIQNYFKKNNIGLLTDTMAENIKNNAIISGNKSIKAATIIWTAGIKANAINTEPKLVLDKGDTIKTNEKLKIPGYGNVYAAGDAALFMENNGPLVQTAQTAWQEGVNIGKNILRRINGKNEKDFHYFHKGALIVLGKNMGIFNYKKITFGGKFAWFFRHLFYRFRFWQIT